MPSTIHTIYREDVVKFVPGYSLFEESVGRFAVELGVAEGQFSERLLRRTGMHLYSIDAWGDRVHSTEQYLQAVKRLLPFGHRNTIIRARFDEAISLFPDEYFHLVYIDGYAHTGQENGQTLRDWYPKLKSGGVFAGDDFHKDWPKVVEVVLAFATEKKLEVTVLDYEEKDQKWNRYPSWMMVKPRFERSEC